MAFAMSNIGCTKLFIASQDHSALIAGHRAVSAPPSGRHPIPADSTLSVGVSRASGTTRPRL